MREQKKRRWANLAPSDALILGFALGFCMGIILGLDL